VKLKKLDINVDITKLKSALIIMETSLKYILFFKILIH